METSNNAVFAIRKITLEKLTPEVVEKIDNTGQCDTNATCGTTCGTSTGSASQCFTYPGAGCP